MGYPWTYADVFRVAVQLEQDGLAFYRRARELHPKAEVARVFAEIAADEEQHVHDFEEIYQARGGQTARTPEETKAFSDLESIYRSSVFGAPDAERPGARLEQLASAADALALGLRMEEDAIRFYQGLIPLADDEEGRKAIDELILQEKKHASWLRAELGRTQVG